MERRQMQYMLNTISDAVMIVNKYNIIEAANEMTEKIFGIYKSKNNISFDSGRIEKDDIVVLIIDKFETIDEKFGTRDLSFLGIKDIDIEKGSKIIAIGCYRNNEIEPLFKVINSYNDLRLETYFMGLSIHINFDIINNVLNIKIGTELFKSTDSEKLNNMVVISGMDNKVKYYSSKTDCEEFKNLLNGSDYNERRNFNYVPEITDRYLLEAIPANIIVDEIDIAVKNKNYTIKEGTTLLNNYLVHYWVHKIKIGTNDDFMIELKMKDITAGYSDSLKWIDEIENSRINLKHENENDYINKFCEILGSSSEIMNVKYMASRASQSKSTVIIYGESGTGKSLLARVIHKNGKNTDMPFVEVNCASIPETLAESEFFGYEKGAFTGAVTNGKKGFFELAQNGTIFLDEIGELTLSMQAKLLEVIQNRCFYKIGGTKKIDVNIRIIVATNKDLKELVKNGGFRQDLYYRINVFPIRVPPLRERRSDIKNLADKLLKNICLRLDADIKIISNSAMKKLINYNWPGNVRELENVIEAAVNICMNGIILSEDLFINGEVNEDSGSLKERLDGYEKKIINEKMIEFDGDKNMVMEDLKIGRSNLFEKLNKYNIKNP